jgi:hypothetical protein
VGALPQLLGVVFLVTGVSGCALLDLLMGGSAPFDPDAPFPFPTASVTFTSGTASIVIDGKTMVLDQLVGEPGTVPELGTKVTWTDGEGFYLTFTGYPEVIPVPESSFLSMDRVFENQHWMIYNPERCLTTTERADAGGISGSATCRGLEWSDYFASPNGIGLPKEIPGVPAFDAEITFEAH